MMKADHDPENRRLLPMKRQMSNMRALVQKNAVRKMKKSSPGM